MAEDDGFAAMHQAINTQKNDAHTNGDTSGFNVAAIIPMRPAGPGGDKPDQNPFPTKDGGFGRRV